MLHILEMLAYMITLKPHKVVIVSDSQQTALRDACLAELINQDPELDCSTSEPYNLFECDSKSLLIIDYDQFGHFTTLRLLRYVSELKTRSDHPISVLVINTPEPEMERARELALMNCVDGLIPQRSPNRQALGNRSKQLLQAAKVILQEDGLWFNRQLSGELFDDLRSAYSGRIQDSELLQSLSKRQRQVMEYLAQGLSNQQIAQAMFVSEHTVKSHLYSSFKLMGVKNRLEAAKWFAENAKGFSSTNAAH